MTVRPSPRTTLVRQDGGAVKATPAGLAALGLDGTTAACLRGFRAGRRPQNRSWWRCRLHKILDTALIEAFIEEATISA